MSQQLQDIERDKDAMGVMVELTGVFEGIASMRISQIKNQVLQSQAFFESLWQIYTQLRVDGLFRFGRGQTEGENIKNKDLYIVITAEGGFSGDIDQKLIELMLKAHDPSKQDIIVIGHHGAIQLAQHGIQFSKYFKLPSKDQNINVGPLIKEVQQYKSTKVFYQTYVSLMVQDVKQIELGKEVQKMGKSVEKIDDIISEETYIFEPSTYAVIDHLEGSMMRISLSQVILESKLAQYASRFRAMTAARNKANDTLGDLSLLYNQARRGQKDERLKEIVGGLKKAQML